MASKADLEKLVAAYAEQGQPQAPPQTAPMPKKKSGFGIDSIVKAPYALFGFAKDKIDSAVVYGDSFLSSFIRNSVRNYAFATGVYATIANPIIGIPYLFIAMPAAKYGANIAYNTIRGAIGLVTYPILNPIDLVSRVFKGGIDPLGWINAIINAPIAAIKKIATEEKHNALGSKLGKAVGLVGGVYAMTSDVWNELFSAFTTKYHAATLAASEKLTYSHLPGSRFLPAFVR